MRTVPYERDELSELEASLLERVSEIRSAPAPATLQALIEIVHYKLEINARLRIVAYEARSAGNAADAELFSDTARAEQEQIVELLAAIRRHLNAMGPPLHAVS